MFFTVPPAASRLLMSCMLAAAFVCTSACDKNEPSPGGTPGGTVRPGSRLSWTQAAASVVQLRTLTYRLYVDGAPNSLADPRCDETASAGGYECSGGLPTMAPGRRVLELTSILAGVESDRSAPLTITFGTAATTEMPGLTPAGDDAQADSEQSASATVCVADLGTETCYGRRTVAKDLQHVSQLTALPDGRALFVDSQGAIQFVANGTLAPEAALRLEDPTSRIVGLAVDADFASSGSIFVAWTSESPRGLSLSITRYRELQNTLGEGATIVSGLPFHGTANAPLAVDANGLLYVALPGSSGQSGAILRYTRDGYVPDSNPSSSAVIGAGFAQPLDLAIDPRTSQVWMSGDDPARAHSITMFSNLNQLASRAGATGVLNRQMTGETPTLAIQDSTTTAAATTLLMTANGSLLRAEFSKTGTLQNLRQVLIQPELQVLSVAPQQNGSWYLLVGTADGPQSILLLTAK
jgi:hypothetical protein